MGGPTGPLVEDHGGFKTRQLVQLHSLQGAAELNGKLGRLRKFDVNSGRWEVDVRGGLGTKRLKEDNLQVPPVARVPEGLSAEDLKSRGNDCFKVFEFEPTNGKAYYRRGCAVLGMAPSASRSKEAIAYLEIALSGRASGGADGIILPNAMRNEVSNLLEYAKRRLDSCIEAAVPDVEQCRENCKQQ